jgi:hypothetical protein
MRASILIASFLPFLYFGLKDNVSVTEHFLHLGISVMQAAIFVQALRGNLVMMFAALILFMVSGGIDEYIFHHSLPGEESDLHAKGHLALFFFVIIAVTTLYLEAHGWRLPLKFRP